MRQRHPNAPVRGPPDPVQVFYYGSDNTIEPVFYIVCLHGQVPENYELWRINDCGVCEVHLSAEVRLLQNFREDTFKTLFFDLRRCRITFIGQISLNASVEFICYANVTSDAKVVISTPNLFVHEWGTNPTMLCPNVSNFNQRTYVPITSQKGFRQRCNHKRMRLKWVEGKRVAPEDHLARVRKDICDDVAANYDPPPVNNDLGDASPANSPRSPLSNYSNSGDNWVQISGSK